MVGWEIGRGAFRLVVDLIDEPFLNLGSLCQHVNLLANEPMGKRAS